jgi:hypothetical protein
MILADFRYKYLIPWMCHNLKVGHYAQESHSTENPPGNQQLNPPDDETMLAVLDFCLGLVLFLTLTCCPCQLYFNPFPLVKSMQLLIHTNPL